MALTVTDCEAELGCRNAHFRGAPTASSNVLIAAPGVKKAIRVYAFSFIGAGSDNAVYFSDGISSFFGGSDGRVTVNAAGPAGGVALPLNERSWFTGAENQALSLVCSSTEAVLGIVTYRVIDTP